MMIPMTAKNKARGNTLEREVVKEFTLAGHVAQRAWGSDGKALGEHSEVDVLVGVDYSPVDRRKLSIKIQCKRKKKIPEWIGLTEHVDVAVIREDRGTPFILMPLDTFIKRFL